MLLVVWAGKEGSDEINSSTRISIIVILIMFVLSSLRKESFTPSMVFIIIWNLLDSISR